MSCDVMFLRGDFLRGYGMWCRLCAFVRDVRIWVLTYVILAGISKSNAMDIYRQKTVTVQVVVGAASEAGVEKSFCRLKL